jgi:hypothetical protein
MPDSALRLQLSFQIHIQVVVLGELRQISQLDSAMTRRQLRVLQVTILAPRLNRFR